MGEVDVDREVDRWVGLALDSIVDHGGDGFGDGITCWCRFCRKSGFVDGCLGSMVVRVVLHKSVKRLSRFVTWWVVDNGKNNLRVSNGRRNGIFI